MKKLLLIAFLLTVAKKSFTQDSLTAIYLDHIIDKIESRLSTYILEMKDTSIFDGEDSSKTAATLKLHTEHYINRSNKIEKIVERSKYKNWTTELIVYYQNEKPIRFSTIKWFQATVKVDFDIYYLNDQPVYTMKRDIGKGKPDAETFLKWCYQLLKEK